MADRCLGGGCWQTDVSEGGQCKGCPSDSEYWLPEDQTKTWPSHWTPCSFSSFYFCVFSSSDLLNIQEFNPHCKTVVDPHLPSYCCLYSNHYICFFILLQQYTFSRMIYKHNSMHKTSLNCVSMFSSYGPQDSHNVDLV